MAGLFAVLYGIGAYGARSRSPCSTPSALSAIWSFRSRSTRARPDRSSRAWSSTRLLLGLFAVQHSVMARPGFKRWWTRLVPRSIERSTYVLFAEPRAAAPVLAVAADPRAGLDGADSDRRRGPRRDLLARAGRLLVFVSTFLISHFELFGLSQVFCPPAGQRAAGAAIAHAASLSRRPAPDLSQLPARASWATPSMTAGHLLFAVATTGYILIAIQLGERDLIAMFRRPSTAVTAGRSPCSFRCPAAGWSIRRRAFSPRTLEGAARPLMS